MPTPKYRPIGKDVLRYRVDVPRIIHGHEGALICPHEAVRIHGWFACVPIKPDDVPSRTNGARVAGDGDATGLLIGAVESLPLQPPSTINANTGKANR